jgi:hypothetical protein
MNGNSDGIAQALAGWDDIVKVTIAIQKRTRRFVHWLAFALVVDILLTFVVSWAVVDVHHQAQARCRLGNEFRAADKARWEYVEQLSASNPQQTAGEAAVRAQLQQYLDKTDAPVVCH